MLLVFGLISFFSNPLKKARHGGQKEKGTLAHNGVTAFLVTFSNPLIILLFIALFAQLNFIIPSHPALMVVGYASIVAGAVMWWYGLTWAIDKIRERFDQTGVVIINRIIGGCVIFFSLVSLIGTLFNIYLFPQLQQ